MSERKRVLIVHGWTNRRASGHWQRRLAAALRRGGHVVAYPQLPDTDTPRLADWMDVVSAELDLLAEAGDGETVVVAHSLGCLTWLQTALAGRVPMVVDRVLLVAPADPDLCGDAASFQLDLTHPAVTSAAKRAAASTLLVASDADPWIPRGISATFAEPLGLPHVLVKGAKHFALDDGWGPWQGVIDWVNDRDADVGLR